MTRIVARINVEMALSCLGFTRMTSPGLEQGLAWGWLSCYLAGISFCHLTSGFNYHFKRVHSFLQRKLGGASASCLWYLGDRQVEAVWSHHGFCRGPLDPYLFGKLGLSPAAQPANGPSRSAAT